MALLYKAFLASITKVTPSGPDMDAINDLAIEKQEPEQLYCGTMHLANDQRDRSFEKFPLDYLKKFAETIVGKSVMTGHNYRELPVGRFYDAEVHKVKGVNHLIPSYFMMSDDDLVPRIKAGVIKGVSIGFEPDKRLCDICQKDYDGWWNDMDDDDPCFHIAGREYEVDGAKVVAEITYGGDVEKVEAVEGSFVWLGCQYGAETVGGKNSIGPQAKSAFFADVRRHGKVWAMNAAGLVVPEGGAPPALSSKEKQMGEKLEDKGNEKTPDPKLEALVKAGERYKARMLETIKTRYDACGMEGTGAAIVAALKDADAETVEAAEKDAQKVFDERHAPKGVGVPDSAGDASAQEEARKILSSPQGFTEDYL